MATAFTVKFYMYPIGTSDFLHAFFSTVCGRLENGKWGSRYPYLMNELYQGMLSAEHLEAGAEELAQIKQALARFAPNQVIWNIEDLSLTHRGATTSAAISPTSATTLLPVRETTFSRYFPLH